MARILLADDDAAAREILARALLADGHTVEVAQDGQEALGRVEAGSGVEVLLTDVQMPGLDGVALARRVVSLRPAIRVVLLSGYVDQLERGRAALGDARVRTLTKPVSLEALRATLRELLA
jgi:CheY-like chemotaxis protein